MSVCLPSTGIGTGSFMALLYAERDTDRVAAIDSGN